MLMLLLGACAPDINLVPVNNFCQDVDLDNLPPSELFFEGSGETGKVWLANYLAPSGLVFSPELAGEGRTIHVYQAWEGEGGEADFCYEPTVEMSGISGKIEVRWYLEDDHTVPYDTIELEN
jgi:hypothetical protein